MRGRGNGEMRANEIEGMGIGEWEYGNERP